MEYLKKKKIENNNLFEEKKKLWIKEGDFNNYNIEEISINNLKKNGYHYLFPIQQKTFNSIFEGKDVIGKDRTGSGKTLAFSLPILEKLRKENIFNNESNRSPILIIIVPTRELCLQVSREIEKWKNFEKEFDLISIYGGTSIQDQIYKLKRGVDIVIGTPGRLIDLQKREVLKCESIKTIILDETDQMLDKGFKDDIETIIENIKQDNQNNIQFILFSATVPKWIFDISNKYLNENYLFYDLVKNSEIETSETVEHLAISFNDFDHKLNSISDILSYYTDFNSKIIIFTEKKVEANEILSSGKLKIKADILHGDIPQKKREITFKHFKEGKIKCLIATNIAARGLDIPEIDFILQMSPPSDIESYIHRSGRTARAGKSGICITLYLENEKYILEKIENRARIKFTCNGFPQSSEIIKASSYNLKKTINDNIDSNSNEFNNISKNLIKEMGAEDAISKAIAWVLRFDKEIKERSLLCSLEGLKSFIIKVNFKVKNVDYFWDLLKNNFSEMLNESVKEIKLLKNKDSCIFDIDSNFSEEFENLENKENFEIICPKELPELDENNHNKYSNNRYNNKYSNNKYNNNDKFTNKNYNNNGDKYNNNKFGNNKYSNNNKFGNDKFNNNNKFGNEKFNNNKFGNDKFNNNNKFGNDKYSNNNKFGNDKYSNNKFGNDKYSNNNKFDNDKYSNNNKFGNDKYSNNKYNNNDNNNNNKFGNDKYNNNNKFGNDKFNNNKFGDNRSKSYNLSNKTNNFESNKNNKNMQDDKNKNKKKLIIKNINTNLNENDVVNFFKNSNIKLDNFFMPKDDNNNNKGFGFGFVSSSQLNLSLSLNGQIFKGKKVYIELSKK